MAVLISGGTGFVGLNLAEALLARGEHVVLLALDAPPPAALRRFAALPGRLTTAQADVRDADAFAALLKQHAVDRLFPFAAVTPGPTRESDAPEQVFAVNLLGLVAQLRAARDAGVRRIVVPSSAAVYGESAYSHALLDEATTPCVPLSVYGVSKYAVERTALRLAALWDLDVVAVRIGAVFGPWERDTGLRDLLTPFWRVAQSARRGAHVVLPATLPRYGYVYARDVAAGLLHLLDLADPVPRVFNLCSGQDFGTLLPRWCEVLAQGFPGFTWGRSDDAAAVTLSPGDTRPRGLLNTARLAAAGFIARFDAEAAFADYRAWLLDHGGP
jgi:nucleoside-diphosphate-sugar epimerase